MAVQIVCHTEESRAQINAAIPKYPQGLRVPPLCRDRIGQQFSRRFWISASHTEQTAVHHTFSQPSRSYRFRQSASMISSDLAGHLAR
jgi:hypothetical protein